VTWRRQGDAHPLTIGLYPFAPDSRLSVDHNERTSEWSLIIQDVTPQDEGVYHCQVTSKDDEDNMYNVHLYVARTSSLDKLHQLKQQQLIWPATYIHSFIHSNL